MCACRVTAPNLMRNASRADN